MASSLYSRRPFRASDLQAMIDMVSLRPAEWMTVYPFIVDLRETAGTPQGQAGFSIWECADGEMAGFALLEGSFLTFEISPGAAFSGLAEQITAWGSEKLDFFAQAEGLVTNCRDGDRQRLCFLEQHGFLAQPVRTLHFQRSLNEPIPAPQLPPGFMIRPLRGEEEAEVWVALHRAAHGTQSMTVEFRLAMMRALEYAPELDLVAVAPDGRLAAYVMGHYSLEENRLRQQKVGYTDPVATHPDFQRMGLARALLLAGFAGLKACGMEFAEVSTWGENSAMIRAAEAVGYQRCSTTIFFRFIGNRHNTPPRAGSNLRVYM